MLTRRKDGDVKALLAGFLENEPLMPKIKLKIFPICWDKHFKEKGENAQLVQVVSREDQETQSFMKMRAYQWYFLIGTKNVSAL